MQTKHLCVLIHIWNKGEVGTLLNRFKPSGKIFYWPFQSGASFVDLLCVFSVLCLLCLCARMFICTLWSPAGKGLNPWLSFVVSNYEFVTFPLVSWVRYGTWLYRFLIFAPLLILKLFKNSKWVWSGNTTITNRKQTYGTTRKSHTTITRHQEDKLSKVTSSLFPIQMIAKLEWT